MYDTNNMTKETSSKAPMIALIIALAVGVWFLLPQIGVVVFTALMAYLFYPLYLRLKRGKGGMAAALTLFASFLVVIIPLIFITVAAISQIASLADTVSRIQNWTPRSKAPRKNCGGTWTPRGAESYSACWTHRTHCWLNPS